MASKSIKLREGWLVFNRALCKEGWIDKWQGHSNNNPNDPVMHTEDSTKEVTYYRSNNGTWLRDKKIGATNMMKYLELRGEYTADEIWSQLKTA